MAAAGISVRLLPHAGEVSVLVLAVGRILNSWLKELDSLIVVGSRSCILQHQVIFCFQQRFRKC